MRCASPLASSRFYARFGQKQALGPRLPSLQAGINTHLYRSASSSASDDIRAAQPLATDALEENHWVYLSDPQSLVEDSGANSGDNGTLKRSIIDTWCHSLVNQLGTSARPRRRPDQISSAGGYRVLGSFNTIHARDETQHRAGVYIPGAPPQWQPPSYPHQIPEKPEPVKKPRPMRFSQADEADTYLWEVPLKGIEALRPHAELPRIDVVITARRLEEFWKYAVTSKGVDIAANVSLVHNTMFIDGFEPVGLETGTEADRTTRFAACGNAWPPEFSDSLRHHRIVSYRLSHLKIAVVTGVDTTLPRDTSPYGVSTDLSASIVVYDNTWPPPEPPKYRGMYQLWLRRCPYLISCRREDGQIVEQRIQLVREHWKQWEKLPRQQMALQRMVLIFSKLKALLLQKPPGTAFIVRREQLDPNRGGSGSPLVPPELSHHRAEQLLDVFEAGHEKLPLSAEDAEKFKPPETAREERTSFKYQRGRNNYQRQETGKKERDEERTAAEDGMVAQLMAMAHH